MKRGTRRWMGGVLLAVLCAGAFLIVWSADSPPAHPALPPKIPVTATSVAVGDVPIELEAPGHMVAFASITVRSQVTGVVKQLAFKDGQYVRKGALLIELDPSAQQATVDQDHATMRRDQANLANTQDDYRRYGPLAKKGIVSQQQLTTSKSQVSQLQATLASDAALLARDQVLLGYTTVRAPVDGVLGLHLVDVGNVVNATDAAGVVVLTQVQPITALFALPQSDLDEVQSSRAVSGDTRLRAEVWNQDGTRLLDTGTLDALSNQVDETSGTVTLKAVFPNPRRLLWPGASVLVRLVLDVQHGGLTVPDTALDQGPQGSMVWTIADNGRVHPSPIEVTQQLRGQVLVTKGLKAGELVVTNGQYGLTDNAMVEVENPQKQEKRQQAEAGGQAEDGETLSSATPLRSNHPGRLGLTE